MMVASDSNKPALDLDGLIEESVEFKLLNLVRVIKPVDVATMFKFTNAMEDLSKKASANASSSELLKSYFEIFSSCVDPFSMEDLLKMSAPQVLSLYGLLLRRIYGEDLAKTFDQKKKIKNPLQAPGSTSAQPKSWLRRLFSSDGSHKSV